MYRDRRLDGRFLIGGVAVLRFVSEPGWSGASLTDDLRVVRPVQNCWAGPGRLEPGIVVTNRVPLPHHVDRPQLLGLASPHLNQRLVECIIDEPSNNWQ